MTAKNFDILVIGATGFVGKRFSRQLSIYCEQKNLSYCLSARSKEKLAFALYGGNLRREGPFEIWRN